MFKRLFWMALGVGGSLWVQRRFKRQIERFAPEHVARQVATTARVLGRDVQRAAEEGRTAMREREESLRAQFRPAAR